MAEKKTLVGYTWSLFTISWFKIWFKKEPGILFWGCFQSPTLDLSWSRSIGKYALRWYDADMKGVEIEVKYTIRLDIFCTCWPSLILKEEDQYEACSEAHHPHQRKSGHLDVFHHSKGHVLVLSQGLKQNRGKTCGNRLVSRHCLCSLPLQYSTLFMLDINSPTWLLNHFAFGFFKILDSLHLFSTHRFFGVTPVVIFLRFPGMNLPWPPLKSAMSGFPNDQLSVKKSPIFPQKNAAFFYKASRSFIDI